MTHREALEALRLACVAVTTGGGERVFVHTDPIKTVDMSGNPSGLADFDYFNVYYVNDEGRLNHLTVRPEIRRG